MVGWTDRQTDMGDFRILVAGVSTPEVEILTETWFSEYSDPHKEAGIYKPGCSCESPGRVCTSKEALESSEKAPNFGWHRKGRLRPNWFTRT